MRKQTPQSFNPDCILNLKSWSAVTPNTLQICGSSIVSEQILQLPFGYGLGAYTDCRAQLL